VAVSDSTGRLTLWAMEIFDAIAEDLSISGAARRVGASVSSVSQQLSNLESALGTELVDRAARPLRLTPAGVTFRRRAQAILGEAAAARAELSGEGLRNLARLGLGMIEDFEADVTPRFLFDMAAELGSCRFLLETGASHHLYAQLGAGALDMIVAADLDAGQPRIERHPLMSEPFVAVLPAGWPGGIADGAAAGLDDLAGLPLIHYTQRHHMGRVIAAHLAHHARPPAHRFELDSYHAIMALVAQGAGWTIATPLGVLRAQRFLDRVRMVPLPLPPLARSVSLAARQGELGPIPAQMAARLRPLIAGLIVEPALDRHPWLAGLLRLETPGEARPALAVGLPS